MRVAVTGATGLIGGHLVRTLRERGDEVTILSRSAADAAGPQAGREPASRVVRWDPEAEAAPADALAGRDAVVHLAGEPLAQRWTPAAKERIRRSRETGTANLVSGIEAADPRPRALVSASGVGYYGPRGDEVVGEDAPPGDDFLAQVCVGWEAAARAAEALGVRVTVLRTGVVLDRSGGALAKMLPFFKAGIGGPVAGGRQFLPWIHVADIVGMYTRAIDDAAWRGPINATAPDPPTNREFSRALGRALRRPAFAPVPGFAVRTLYGEMADIVITGQRAVPKRAQGLGYDYRQPELESALRSALAR